MSKQITAEIAAIRADIFQRANTAALAARDLEQALHQLLMPAAYSAVVLDGNELDNQEMIDDLKLAQDIVHRIKKKATLVAIRTQARA
jgi:predicted TIM-barrel enzyme